jgi:UDP-arabinose 4-epimerase
MQALARAGYSPVTFDNLERDHDWAVKWGPLERGDLRDEKALHRVFERWKPRAVMHFAAYADIGESNIDPLTYYDNHIGGSAKLFNTCAAFESKNFQFCATFGIPSHVPATSHYRRVRARR